MANSIMAQVPIEEEQTLDDRELIKAVAAKDKQAFEQLYRRYSHRIGQFVGKMLRDPQMAEEVVDDTLFAIWKSADRFQYRSSVSTWIFGIAYRQALKALERENKHRLVDNDEKSLVEIEDPMAHANPEASTEFSDMNGIVARGIARLSDDHRTAVQLTAMGHSYQEIADITGCPANTVKTRVFYARSKLRDFLGHFDTIINK